MREKYAKAKAYAKEHPFGVGVNVGIFLGAGVVLASLKRQPVSIPDILVLTTSEMLRDMADNPSGSLRWAGNPDVVLANEANPGIASR